MALNLLPNEVLTQILQDVWDLRPNIPPFIAFRLISREYSPSHLIYLILIPYHHSDL